MSSQADKQRQRKGGHQSADIPSRSFWSWDTLARIPVRMLEIPIDTMLYGLDRLAALRDETPELTPPAPPPFEYKPVAPVAPVVVLPPEPPPAPAAPIVPIPEPDPPPLLALDDLHGGDLKLVCSRILFVKRGFEFSFPSQEDLIYDDIDARTFEAWKVAEFIQQLAEPDKAPLVPASWSGFLPDSCRHRNGRLRRFPHGDHKYLRVCFDVLNRYPRESLRYEDNHLRLLREIAEPLGHYTRRRLAGTDQEPGDA